MPYFIAHENGTIYGHGTTEAAALEEAREWVDLDENGQPQTAGLTIDRATAALARNVEQFTGEEAWGWIEDANGPRIACTVEEEESAQYNPARAAQLLANDPEA